MLDSREQNSPAGAVRVSSAGPFKGEGRTGLAAVLGEEHPLVPSVGPYAECPRRSALTEISVPTTCPMAHHTLKNVRRYCCGPGINSRNMTPSMGKLPPAPKPIHAMSEANATKLGAAPAATPKMPAMRRVQFQDRRRLYVSAERERGVRRVGRAEHDGSGASESVEASSIVYPTSGPPHSS